MENTEVSSVEARRSFLKKVAYTAPAVIALGSLTLPVTAQASTFTNTFTDAQGNTMTSTVESNTKYAYGSTPYGQISSGTYDGDSYTASDVETKSIFKWFRNLF